MCLREAPRIAYHPLDPSAQTVVRIEYGRYLDSRPPTCSMERKIERFRSWLRDEKGIAYPVGPQSPCCLGRNIKKRCGTRRHPGNLPVIACT